LTYGRIFNDHFIANLLLSSVPVKQNFENWSTFGKDIDKSKYVYLAMEIPGQLSVLLPCCPALLYVLLHIFNCFIEQINE